MVIGLLGIEPEVLADGVAARPEALRELLFNDHHLRGVEGVVLGEIAAFDQRDLHRAEVVRTGVAYGQLAVPGPGGGA